MTKANVLLVVGEPEMRAQLEIGFAWNGFPAFTAPNGHSALLQLGIVQPDLIVLDLDLAEGEGLDTLRRIRDISTVPIILLAPEGGCAPAFVGLQEGADCCLERPISILELRARARALVRRASSEGSGHRGGFSATEG